jgi:NADH-quinone oxidoreductase subunit C
MSEINDQMFSRIKEKLEGASAFSGVFFLETANYPTISIPKEKLLDVCKVLRDDLQFDQLRDVVGVDRFTKNDRFECIYNLYSTTNKNRLFINVKLDSKNPEVESLYPIWQSADWAEREAYDMFGINFKNHPDLRRMYMMEEFRYYPLRKDYPLMGLPGAVQLPKK